MSLAQAQDETKTEIEKMLSDVQNVNIGDEDFKDLERICEEKYEASLKEQVQLRGINDEGSIWEEAKNTGKFELKGAVGAVWYRMYQNDEKLKPEYLKIKGNGDKRTSREEWAKEQFKDLDTQKNHQHEFSV
eukprot:4437659-Karenia_brevis.AAC.1